MKFFRKLSMGFFMELLQVFCMESYHEFLIELLLKRIPPGNPRNKTSEVIPKGTVRNSEDTLRGIPGETSLGILQGTAGGIPGGFLDFVKKHQKDFLEKSL